MIFKNKSFNYRKCITLSLCILFMTTAVNLAGCSKKTEAQRNEKVESNKEVDKIETNIDVGEKEKDKDKDKGKDKKENIQQKEVIEEKDNIPEKSDKVKFTKQQLDKNVQPEFATSWINSPNKKISLCIEGRGPDASEEGLGKIYAKDLSNGEKWSLEIMPSEEQNTPKFIQWIDDENVISIVGLGYGTVAIGGNLYKINVKTGEATVLYDTKTPKVQVISAKEASNKIEIQLLVYDDNEFTKTHTEKKVINLK